MGMKQFSGELRRFLATEEPEVLCITGKWGVGKTFAWRFYLREAKDAKAIGLEKYAYVSLFGQSALDDVRYAIFENTIPRDEIGKKADLKTFEKTVDTLWGRWRGLLRFSQYIPRFGDTVFNLAKLGFLSVRKQVVCIDDLERAGKNLDPRDLLGLVSFLKEERDCKVVLLLNDEALEEQKLQEFRTQLEKVADTVLRFEPTPLEAVEIGVDKSQSFSAWLANDCIGLGVVNIRLIKRIERLAKRLQEELKSFDRRVLQQAVHSAALFCFAKYQPPGTAPPLEFIKDFNPYEGVFNKDKTVVDPNAIWRALLLQFGWTHTDEFDAVIFRCVEQGSFDTAALKAAAEEKEKELKIQDKDRSFSDAWDLYHGSFADNSAEVIAALTDSIAKCAPAISPMNLSSTISFLKEMDAGSNAKDLIRKYVEVRSSEPRDFWRLDKAPFGDEVKDADVREAFKEKCDSLALAPDVAEILQRIGVQKGWNSEDVSVLGMLTSDDFLAVFKSQQGDDLRRVVYGALMFRDIGNSSEAMKSITKNAEDALRKIGKESKLNARRVRAFGIDLSE
ncbi:hypothetical protein ACQR1I_12495 [Bradyrhizobium sp. HKCCYLS2038]|uniref:hypothetical protein n=1 Tax=unclassified Bradyrhizobium TaxID=2631580 RepID=UPI003EC0CD57